MEFKSSEVLKAILKDIAKLAICKDEEVIEKYKQVLRRISGVEDNFKNAVVFKLYSALEGIADLRKLLETAKQIGD